VGAVFVAAWAYHAVRAHNAVKKREEQIMGIAFRGHQQQHDLMQDVRVPDVFDEARMAADLSKLATSPTLIGQYLAQASMCFKETQQVKILKKWEEFYKAGEAVIRARTGMADAYGDYKRVNTKAQIAAKQQVVDIAVLDGDHEEALLRKTKAQKERENLNKKEPPPPPLLTAEQERILKKDEIQTAIARLEQESNNKLAAITDEERRIQIQNMYDDQIARLGEQLRRYL